MTESEYRRTSKKELARRLRNAQNQLDDARLELVNVQTRIENVEGSVRPLREMLEDSKREAAGQRSRADRLEKDRTEAGRIEARLRKEIASLKRTRLWVCAWAALAGAFVASAALVWYMGA